MNVKAILAAKVRNLGGDIISIEPTADLSAAAKLLSAHRIGAVVICGAGGRLAGILSERDIVRALSEHGGDALAFGRSFRFLGRERARRIREALLLREHLALELRDLGGAVFVDEGFDLAFS